MIRGREHAANVLSGTAIQSQRKDNLCNMNTQARSAVNTAALRISKDRQIEELRAELAAMRRRQCQEEEVQVAESDFKETLKEVVSKLSAYDKIVRISFDEVSANKELIHS
uniref:Uncharacterized protein n=1 Tax=Glossina palpalis gambiensis TaxID=67801 RepID=A0A1B0C077_9MUSC